MKSVLVLGETLGSIRSASDLFDKVKRIDIDGTKEHFIVCNINTKNQVIDSSIVSIGTLNESLVHPREVFRKAIIDNAASVIVAHNHPSGDLRPSDDDVRVTKTLDEAGKLLGIKLLDHIVFNSDSYYSMKEGGLF